MSKTDVYDYNIFFKIVMLLFRAKEAADGGVLMRYDDPLVSYLLMLSVRTPYNKASASTLFT